ncbi:hypothetical protein D3C76_145510 [compost metagenome]|uniref:Uncharacterized protein n=1 Tax=Paenibacillus rhizolycopersici TaxID=2780073 RepID=A0ABS2H8J9_9BACL|nr:MULTISPECIES: hypothetical protein [Paenibacillus]MBM6997742.1 hypothetical protein [Paenibacillus rhizolycopersici]GIP50524.1 hypothetical protein J53TS2_41150 [Paenibacillus sp. J53TS2]
MPLKYRIDSERVQIRETANDVDVEFELTFLQEEPLLSNMREVQKRFEDNDVYTDVLFYLNQDQERQYKIIVRKDYYEDFLLALLKYRILEGLEWTE